jgi:hypothetical protein
MFNVRYQGRKLKLLTSDVKIFCRLGVQGMNASQFLSIRMPGRDSYMCDA